jgi:hypothetical protein
MKGHFIPRPTVQQPAGLLLVDSTPLLEEKRDPNGNAVITDLLNPLRGH